MVRVVRCMGGRAQVSGPFLRGLKVKLSVLQLTENEPSDRGQRVLLAF